MLTSLSCYTKINYSQFHRIDRLSPEEYVTE